MAAIFAPLIAPFDPYTNNMRLRFCPPLGERCPGYLLGADNQGRDMLSRILFGLRATLGMGVIAVAVGGGLGALIGLSAAYFKRLDTPLMRLVDVLLSFPSILFGLAIAAVLGTGLFSLVIALSVAAVPSIARIARGAAQSIMQQEYMEAGRAVGLGDAALIWRYLARNCWPTILIYMTLQLGQAILLGRRPLLPRPRRAAADGGTRQHGGRRPQVPADRAQRREPSVRGDLPRRSRFQRPGRRAARRPRSQAQAIRRHFR